MVKGENVSEVLEEGKRRGWRKPAEGSKAGKGGKVLMLKSSAEGTSSLASAGYDLGRCRIVFRSVRLSP